MARLLFTLWFALVSLPGPGVCCCSLLARPFRPLPARQDAPKPPAAACCCCCQEARPAVPSRSAQEAPSHHDCHCKDSAQPASLAEAPKAGAQGVSSHTLLVPPQIGERAPGARPCQAACGGDVLLPFHPTSELLRAHHLLRC
jgi:hypothetical protein